METTLLAVLAALLSFIGIRVFAADDDSPPLAKAPFSAEQAKDLQQQWADQIGNPLVHTNSIGMKLALIPPGELTMGRTEEQFDELLRAFEIDPELKKDRVGMITWSMLMMPAHRVRITRPFYMGTTEITAGQFRQFVEATGYKTEAERGLHGGRPYHRRPLSTWRKPMAWRRPPLVQTDNEPVVHLSWNDCVAFCKWLSEKEGVVYRLPTEAEWEYACRTGATTPWSFGGLKDVDRVGAQYAIWSDTGQKFDTPQQVAQRLPNAFGLYDMHGNVWEYVADWWHRLSYKEARLNDPTGPSEQSEKGDMRRIIRGGSFDWGRWGADAAYRMRISQRSTQHPHMGFRVAMRIKGVKCTPPAVDPDEDRRRRKRDPGAESPEIMAALRAGAEDSPSGGRDLPKELTIDLGDGVEMDFVLIPSGAFLMGSPQGPKDERPVHRVVISRPFYMARYPLTQGQWKAVMGNDKGLRKLWDGDDSDALGPAKMMVGLSWNDCSQLASRLRQKLRKFDFDLPTEAQWEYACRADSASEYFFGDDPSKLDEYAWFEGNMIWPGKPAYQGVGFYPGVGQRRANPWGLYDIHGGVWEWCRDWYDADYYFDSPLVDPPGPATGRFKVLRGGSWFRYPKYARSAYRRFFHPEGDSGGVTAWINDFGCRLVINLAVRTREASLPSNTAGRKVYKNREAAADAEETAAKPSARSEDQPQSSDGRVNYTQMARSLVRDPHNPVLKVGEKGAWNDQTLGCLTVLHDGPRFYLYSGGAQYGKSKNVGMALSNDGVDWKYYERNPLFPGSMPYAIKVGDTFRLYYPGGQAGLRGLQMRTSKDGLNWSGPRQVLDGGILDPCVVRAAKNRFHLYYCSGGRKTKKGKQVWEFKNYVVTSADGIQWDGKAQQILPLGVGGSWDSMSNAGPVVLKLPDGFHLWYLGSGPYKNKVAWRIGHAASPDGIHWTKSSDEPVLDIAKPGNWDGGTFMSFDIIFLGGKLLFWYAAAPTEHGDETKMTIQIGYGTSK